MFIQDLCEYHGACTRDAFLDCIAVREVGQGSCRGGQGGRDGRRGSRVEMGEQLALYLLALLRSRRYSHIFCLAILIMPDCLYVCARQQQQD